MEKKLELSYTRGYATAFDGKNHFKLTFDSIKTRSKIEPKLSNKVTKLPKGFVIKKVKGLEWVGKICSTLTDK